MTRLLTILLLLAAFAAAQDTARPGMFVDGRFLYDKCGERVVLRGINAMIVYWDRAGTVTYPEIAKTGANVCRIFWKLDYPTPTVEQLDTTLTNCIAQGMIPMAALFGATSAWDSLEQNVDFWCLPEVAAVIRKHQDYTLLNIANEAGDDAVTDSAYRAGYARAIDRIRAAGIHVPLVIDAARWGRGEEYILDNAQFLVEHDPDHNILFSWHFWDPINFQAHPGTPQRIKAAVDSSIALDICMIVGEFSYCEDLGTVCNQIAWQYLISYADSNDIGWLPWVWWCCADPAGRNSMTVDKVYGHWIASGWGESIAVTHPHSIANTARRSGYFVRGSCDTASVAPRPQSGVKGNDTRMRAYLLDGRRVPGHSRARASVLVLLRGDGQLARRTMIPPVW